MAMLRALPLLCLLAAPALAQTIGGVPSPSATCVDVTIGDARAYECVNRLLQASVPGRGAPGDVGVTTNDPANRTGTFNIAGTRVLLGNAFGNSVVPQRPAPFSGAGPLFGTRPVPLTPSLARNVNGVRGLAPISPAAVSVRSARGTTAIGALAAFNRR
jgi:hypothetical protein